MLVVGAFRTGVHEDDDEVGLASSTLHHPASSGDVRQALRPRVGREAEDGDTRPVDVHVGNLAGPPGGQQSRVPGSGDGVLLPDGAVVHRVVVGEN